MEEKENTEDVKEGLQDQLISVSDSVPVSKLSSLFKLTLPEIYL